MDRPRPVPFPTSLVVKNGSKIRCSSPDGIPCPVSANETSTAPEPVEPAMRMALRGASATASRALVNKLDRKSTRLNSSHSQISYAVFCLKKKNNTATEQNWDSVQHVPDLTPPTGADCDQR